MRKPKYKIGQSVVGRPTFETKVEFGDMVMIEIKSARYETKYGNWIYCGVVELIGDFGQKVEIYEYEIEYKIRGK